MATTLLIISAICFLIANGIDTLISHAKKEPGSRWFFFVIEHETIFSEKANPIISMISLAILMPTSISLAFHINWFLALGIAFASKLIIQGFLVNIYIAIFSRGNLFSSIIIAFIVGIITLIIGVLI